MLKVDSLFDCMSLFSRDFLNSLRLYRTYYGGLADQLCVSELASGDGLSCWNGTNIVKRFVLKRSIIQMGDGVEMIFCFACAVPEMTRKHQSARSILSLPFVQNILLAVTCGCLTFTVQRGIGAEFDTRKRFLAFICWRRKVSQCWPWIWVEDVYVGAWFFWHYN